ncbi:MAG: hypothetical protein GX126_17615 [Bacteroidales bacterium]|nr:hypothetical protein [Bacteroidales bacterium]
MKKNKLAEILGYQPGKEIKTYILQRAKDEKKSVIEIAREMSIPPLNIEVTEGHYMHDGRLMTRFEIINECPERRNIFIKTRK